MRLADRDLRAAEFLNHAAEHELVYGDGSKAPPEIWIVSAPVSGLVLKVDEEAKRSFRLERRF
jgi:HlyD family secretion protein